MSVPFSASEEECVLCVWDGEIRLEINWVVFSWLAGLVVIAGSVTAGGEGVCIFCSAVEVDSVIATAA